MSEDEDYDYERSFPDWHQERITGDHGLFAIIWRGPGAVVWDAWNVALCRQCDEAPERSLYRGQAQGILKVRDLARLLIDVAAAALTDELKHHQSEE